jgi:hypothetical protein
LNDSAMCFLGIMDMEKVSQSLVNGLRVIGFCMASTELAFITPLN